MLVDHLITFALDAVALLLLGMGARFGWLAMSGQRYFRAHRTRMCAAAVVLGGVLAWVAQHP